jgi:hypothetical protein
MLTDHELNVLRQILAPHDFLEEIEEASGEAGLAVLDRRASLVVVVEHPGQIEELVEKGAEWYLESEYNGGKNPVKYSKAR